MAITYQGAGTAAANTTAATTLAVPYPASVAAGDVLVLAVGVSGAAPTNPSGFTSQVSSNSGGSSPAFRISTKVATGSESGSLSVTTVSATSQGRMFLFRGVDQTTPIDVAGATFGSSTATTAYNLPTLTTTTTGVTLVYYGIANAATGTWTPPTVPAAFTEVWDALTTTPRSGVGYLIWSGSGATGTVNLVSSSSVRGAAGLIALRPAGQAASGQVDGTSGVSGSAQIAYAATGQVDAVSGVSGTADLSSTNGTVAATSGVTGSAKLAAAATGTAAATTTATGTAILGRPAAGTSAATTAVTGTAGILLGAAGTITATTTVSGASVMIAPASGTVVALADATGAANRRLTTGSMSFTALVDVTGTAILGRPASGQIDAVTTVTGTAANVQDITATADLEPRTWAAVATRDWDATTERNWKANL